jgi:hypothetical protein
VEGWVPRKARTWPEWWGWEFIFSPHIGRRQEDRGFTEVELRRMLEHADGLEPDAMVGRWRIRTRHRRREWIVVVEPEVDRGIVVVVTAYVVQT